MHFYVRRKRKKRRRRRRRKRRRCEEEEGGVRRKRKRKEEEGKANDYEEGWNISVSLTTYSEFLARLRNSRDT